MAVNILQFDLDFLEAMCTQGWKGDGIECVKGLPPGTELLHAFVNEKDGVLELTVSHPKLPKSQAPYKIEWTKS